MVLMTILSKIGLGSLKTRGKVFLGVIITLTALSGLLYWRFDSVKENLILANKEIEDIARELRVSESTIDSLERDIKLTSDLLKDREEMRASSEALADRLSQKLAQELSSNEGLKECFSIDMSEYVRGLPVSSNPSGH